MTDHFIRPDNDPEPTAAEYAALAEQYQAGYDKAIASGYEEFGWRWRKNRLMTIDALRAYAESPRDRFEEIIRSLRYDGRDTESLTVGEIRRALPALHNS